MGKRMYVISMVKNEEDIIESFVRHALSFADGVLIADHDSSDRTVEILQSLRGEGLPLRVEHFYGVEHAQEEVMQGLFLRAVEECGADFVVPMDADEFLVNTENHTACRELLQQLDTGKIYRLPWRSYAPQMPEQDADCFMLLRPLLRSRSFEIASKMIVGAELARKGGVISQGNHFVYQQDDKEREPLPMEEPPFFHMAHVPWRSKEQYASKVLVGWLSNIAKYSQHTKVAVHYEYYFRQILEGKTVSWENFLQEAEPFSMASYVEPQTLRYTEKKPAHVMRNLMRAGAAHAESYLEQKFLQKQEVVTVIIPFGGDVEELAALLENVREQTYPWKEIFVCYLCGAGDASAAAKALCEEYEDVRYLEGTQGASSLADLPRLAKGRYVQWLLPGNRMHPAKIMRMAASFSMSDLTGEIVMQLSDTLDQSVEIPAEMQLDMEKLLPQWSYSEAEMESLWNIILRRGELFPCDISAALFRRSLMDACGWLDGCFLDGYPLQMSMWHLSLTSGAKGASVSYAGLLRAKYLVRRAPIRWNDLLWQQIEWRLLLEELRPQMAAEDIEASERRMREKQALIENCTRQGASMDAVLYEQYRQTCMSSGSPFATG